MSSKVKAHLALNPSSSPKEKIHEKTIQHLVDVLGRPPAHVENRPSDYDRSIRKTYHEHMQQSRSTSSNKSGKTIPRLGERTIQSIPTLKVSTDRATDIAKDFYISVDQLPGNHYRKYVNL